MGRHNRRSNEYPNAYVFHCEAFRWNVAVWQPEIWLGPWCVWRGSGRASEDDALAQARNELPIRIAAMLGATNG